MKTFDDWYAEKFPNGTTDDYKAELRAAWNAALDSLKTFLFSLIGEPRA